MTTALITVAALACTLTACGNALSLSSDTSGALTLYSGQHPETTDKIVTAFEQRTGITVHVRSNDEDVLADQIVAEGSHSPADVIYTETPPCWSSSRTRPSCRRWTSPPSPPPQPGSTRRRATGSACPPGSACSSTIPALISASQLPRSVMELADPRYKAKLALAAGETDFQPIVTAVLRAHGRGHRALAGRS